MTKEKILITEDNEDLCNLMMDMLSSKLPEYEFVTAYSGHEALAKFDIEKPVLALLDMNLSDTTGREIAKKMQERNPHFPVILVTAYSPTEVGELSQNIQAFIRKPIDRNLLVSTIKEILKSN